VTPRVPAVIGALSRAAMAVLLLAALGVSPPVAHGQKGLAKLAAQYVASYQEQLTAIVADERYVQDVRVQIPAAPGAPRSRTTAGEVFFIFTAPRGWMAIRDVQTVDGAPAPQRSNVREILGSLPARQVADQMRSYNARFNIGRVTRNINEPTLALLSLDETHRSRFHFSTKKRQDVDGRPAVWLAFQEREPPTLIRSIGGGVIYVKGEMLVEAANGRIWETRLNATVDGINVELETEYRLDERLGLLLPVVFRERYEQGKMSADSRTKMPEGPFEQIWCEATYSNFRRFEVLSRIR